MTINQAHDKMMEGKKVKHDSYSPKEHNWINAEGEIIDEKGYYFTEEFVRKAKQKGEWEFGWSIMEEK